jgi:hypothetical protein
VRLLVTGVSRYSFKGEDGKVLQGAKVHGVDLDNREDTEDSLGMLPVEVGADYDVFKHVKPDQLPGFCEASFTVKTKKGKENKALVVIHITALKFVGPLFQQKAAQGT